MPAGGMGGEMGGGTGTCWLVHLHESGLARKDVADGGKCKTTGGSPEGCEPARAKLFCQQSTQAPHDEGACTHERMLWGTLMCLSQIQLSKGSTPMNSAVASWMREESAILHITARPHSPQQQK
eukprot:271341-Pelagomonas_calceolata.AAC.2